MSSRARPGLISQRTGGNPAPPDAEAVSENPPPPSTPPKQTQHYGLYTDGKWYCNCKPRARAKFLTVKKSCANKDRCFYSCPDKDDGCDFFYWAEEADERAAAQGNGDSAAATTPRPKKDQSIKKYFQLREQNENPPEQETPSRGDGDVMEIDEGESPSRPAGGEVRQEEQQEPGPADRPSTPPAPADRDGPTTPTRRPRKRRREDDDDNEYLLPDFSPSEEEQAEQILSTASRRTNMSPPATPAETPTRRPDPSSSTSNRAATGNSSALPTPSTKSSLGATRRRILDSNSSLPPVATTPQHGNTDAPQPQTPHANTAASINADLSSLGELLGPHIDASVSKQLEGHLTRISMKAQNGVSQRDKLRGELDKREREVATLRGRNAALQDEVMELRDGRARVRGKMLEMYKDT